MRNTAMNERRTIVTDATPAMAETFYDRSTSALWTSVILLSMLCIGLIIVWQQFLTFPQTTSHPPIDSPPPIKIHSEYQEPQPPQFDTAVAAPPDEMETLQVPNTLNLQDLATAVGLYSNSATNFDEHSQENSAHHSAHHRDAGRLTVRGPLANRVLSAEDHHWFFEVDAPRSESDYATMLNQFRIQPAAVFSDGTIVYLENKGGDFTSRSESNLQQEQRYFTTWSGGELESLDEALFHAAGIDISHARLVQLLPAELEANLANMEAAYAERLPEQIGRTWFRLGRTVDGFKFTVTKQTAR